MLGFSGRMKFSVYVNFDFLLVIFHIFSFSSSFIIFFSEFFAFQCLLRSFLIIFICVCLRKKIFSDGVHVFFQILLFPEGTDKSAYTTMKSNEYAKKNGLKDLSYVLYPRSAGLACLINKMRECEADVRPIFSFFYL